MISRSFRKIELADAQPHKSVTPVEKTTSDTDSAISNCNCGYVNSKNTSEKPTVLLQTAVATIKNPGNPEITGIARIIFHSGSQLSKVICDKQVERFT